MPNRTFTPVKLARLQKRLQDLNYIAAVNEMIPEAWKTATKQYKAIPVVDRNPLMGSKGEFPSISCTKSRLYHLEMNRMKREAGLIN